MSECFEHVAESVNGGQCAKAPITNMVWGINMVWVFVADEDMSPEERAVLDAKMAEMERVLAEELAALQEQEVDIYVRALSRALLCHGLS